MRLTFVHRRLLCSFGVPYSPLHSHPHCWRIPLSYSLNVQFNLPLAYHQRFLSFYSDTPPSKMIPVPISSEWLKILQARLQQYTNRELPDVQARFRKGRGTRDQIANIHWIIEKARKFQKNMYFCVIGYPKAFDCVNHNKLWKILKEMGIPDHLTCLLRNLYAG